MAGSGDVTLYAVTDQTGDLYGLSETREDAERVLRAASEYLREARDCGHPAAGAWVRKRLPLQVVEITPEDAQELLEEQTPVLDREP